MHQSDEQDEAIRLLTTECDFIAVNSIAGSGKSTLAKEMAKAIGGNILYTSFMKSAINDAEKKFPSNVKCKTTHSICYRDIVPLGAGMAGIKYGPRKVGWFGYRDISEKIKYDDKLTVIDLMEKFFTSGSIAMKSYFESHCGDPLLRSIATTYVQKMVNKEIPVTHGFYMKYYHILLARGVLTTPSYDLAILDELQDSSAVALEIFKLTNAKKKLVVGDPFQSCMAFANSVNGFDYLEELGVETKLSITYRVEESIAKKIELFGKKHLDRNFKFTGLPIEDKTVDTQVYIARTNGSLIAKMIQLNQSHTPYNSARKIKDMFSLILTLLSMKPGCTKPVGEHSFLYFDMLDYNRKTVEFRKARSFISYIMSKHNKDKAIKTACKTIVKYGGKLIWETYNYALLHETAKITHGITLATPHSSKGGTWDEAILDEDMYPEFLREDDMTDEDKQQELNLLYIAATRCRVKLTGANYLTEV